LPSPIAIARIRALLRRERASVVQTWLYHADLMGGLAARSAGLPVAWGVHRSNLDPRYTRRSVILTARICARLGRVVPSRIVCCAESTRRAHVKFGYPAAKMIEIPNGFDLDVFRPNPAARQSVRAELGIPTDATTVGIIGRFVPLKNHRLFVAGAGLALRANPGMHFLMIGDGLTHDSPDLTAWIAATGHRERFHLLGRRTDTAHLLAALDLFALTSDTEAFPLVLGEAMACGVPCIATDVGDAARIIDSTGRIVPPGQPDAFAAALVEMACATTDRISLGQLARQRIADHFALTSVVQQYEDLWLELSGKIAS
jgi:glycosyltransferase involved in cell wall biosynthesis